MSGWISSKLKVAETLLQQIDQQAAESLGKNEESSRSGDVLNHVTAAPAVVIPKKSGDILNNKNKKKKASPPSKSHNPKLVVVDDDENPKSSLTDTDWTQLLSSKPINSGGGLSKDGKRPNLLSFDRKPVGLNKTARKSDVQPASDASFANKDLLPPPMNDEKPPPEALNRVPDLRLQQVSDERNRLKSSKTESLSPPSDGDTDSDSDSSSGSESEGEREEIRKRREQLLAEKAAAKAIEAIKDRENLVARLEGEKQSLEKIIDERAKQQANEASELQTTMMETMEAVDLEKQKHNNTRMEILMKLAKLETTNAELAKSLATAQWSLEVEVKQVAELHRQIELKEASREELTSKKKNHPSGNKLTTIRGVELEHEVLETELTFVKDKVGQLQEKAKTLETTIQVTRKEIENPTEVEVELKRRLGQLTDHLIHKQAQVEALSSEKAMLMFRIEAVSRSLDENKSSLKVPTNDLESGIWELSNSRFQEKLQKGQKHIGSLVRQLDSIFSTGATFLRRNPMARIWSFVYLVCLHFWVLYIFRSHTSAVSYGAGSGDVISLENINNTGV